MLLSLARIFLISSTFKAPFISCLLHKTINVAPANLSCFKRLCNNCCLKAKGKNCPLCNFFPFEEEKNPQMNRFIKNMRLICRYCKKEFQSSEELIKHKCVKPDLSCKYCQFITKDDDGFLKHVSEKHQELILKEMSE